MRRQREIGMLLLGIAVLALGSARVVRAQAPNDASRGVARISLMDGQVSVKRGDAGEWVAGVINAPLMTGDHISTAPNSRAEIELDSANILRIGGNAEVNLATLEYGRFQVEVAHGTVTYAIPRASSANVEVDTPSVSVRPSGQGAYRITVNDGGASQITVRAGQAEIFTPRGSESLSAGQTMQARGSPSDPEFQIVNAIPMDDWDRWNQQRDQALTQARSPQYMPQGVYGGEDLDTYGNWNNVPPYGEVWTPAVSPGWAPYRAGRWVWLDWYGWTWVSYDPWGWAPYHYGRWFWDTGFGWCWYPGVIGVRHYWSPALVAFFGFGPGIGVGFGFGNIGWVPLAPYELFHPWWGPGFYGRGFNQGFAFANVNVYSSYRNARFNGVSGVGVNQFRSGQFGAIARVPGEQVRTAGLIRGQVPIAPSASHLQFTNRAASFVPRSTGNTRFFTHQQPATAARVTFAQQQRAFAQSGGSTNPSAARATYQQPAGAAAGARSPQTGGGGWRRFGEPSGQGSGTAATPRGWNSSPAYQNTRPQASTGGGWGSFGEPRSAPRADPAPRSGYQGGSGYSAPRYNAPAAQPRPSTPSYSAPRSSAPSRPSGGGGARTGGGHSGGGGHHR